MTMSIPTAGPGVGLRFANVDYKMTCTPGCDKGDVMVVDKDVVADGAFTTVIVPTAAADDIESVDTGVACVALEDVAAGASGMFRFSGTVEATGGATVAMGLALMFDTNKELVAATSAGKVVAFGVDAVANDTLGTVIFDGINGFAGVPTD